MTLPWDELSPEPEPSPPPVPPAAPPVSSASAPPATTTTATTVDVGDVIKDAMREVVDYAKQVLSSTMHGQAPDVLHPTITATTTTGRELVVADAKNRSWRTFLQGLVIDIFAALAAIFTTLSQIDPPLDKAAWATVGALAIKTLIQTALAYFMRIRIQPTAKTPEGEKLAIMPVMEPMKGNQP